MSYELSMPSNNAWNGRWSGENDLYAVVRRYDVAPTPDGKQLAGGYFTYSFGDGWAAAITVREVTPGAAAKLRKQSKGFCGYEWMIDSIERHGAILA